MADQLTAVPPRRGRPRDPDVDVQAMRAARELLVEGGYPSVTFGEVARRGRVGRNGLYLRWPDRERLLADAVSDALATPPQSPDTGSLRGDLLAIMEAKVERLRDGDRRAFMRALMQEIGRRPALASVYRRRVVAPWRRAIGQAIGRGVARGEIGADVDADLVAEALSGPLVIRTLITEAPLGPDLAADAVDLVIAGARRA
ncbi:MAG: TetR/AcrR family transcriptional regulator [Thermoleophilia bacterium]|nr:TetR/AcrR family transcriptional regulator [Thermoleophilia bacterium]